MIEVASPIGRIAVEASPRGVTRIDILIRERRFAAAPAAVPSRAPDARAAAHEAAACRALERYFAGDPDALEALPVDLAGGSPFRRRIYDALRAIRFGETTTYGGLAAMVGCPGAARAVGTAMAKNPLSLVIPCHRVLAAAGRIGGYGPGIGVKRRLLAHEARFARADSRGRLERTGTASFREGIRPSGRDE